MDMSYTRNLIGFRLHDDQLQRIARPRLELTTHVALRFGQTFGILGSGIGAGVSAVQGQRDCESLTNKAYTYGRYGVLAGLVVGPLVTAMFCRGKSMDSISDRCYRLRLSNNQVRVDRLSILGAAVGAGVAHYCCESAEKGALFGFTGGCVLAGVVNTIL